MYANSTLPTNLLLQPLTMGIRLQNTQAFHAFAASLLEEFKLLASNGGCMVGTPCSSFLDGVEAEFSVSVVCSWPFYLASYHK